jgi:hypothetical protein
MRGNARASLLLAASCVLAAANAQGQDTAPLRTPDPVEAIATCLAEGLGEVLMSATVQCVPRGTGSDLAESAGTPLGVDAEAVCRDRNDARVLPGDTVKRIAADARHHVAPSGIRIIGAVFCEALDLVGLDLPYSLVLDRSLLARGINARNFSLRGDFSIDYAVVLRSLILTRAKVDGSVYSQGSFLENLILSDTTISGSLHLLRSVLLHDAHLFRISISGDLSINNSALSSFLLQSSRVGGALDLSNSEVRCGYYVKASNVGYALAEHAGFGAFGAVANAGAPSAVDYAWWRRTLEDPYIRQMLGSVAAKDLVNREIAKIAAQAPSKPISGCEHSTGSQYAEFYFFDNRVQSTFCLRSFEWLAPATTAPHSLPVTIVALNGTNVAGNLIVDLWPQTTIHDAVGTEKHKLEAIGVSAGSLIFDFSNTKRPYFTYLDGLSFDRVHTAGSTCEYQRHTSEAPIALGGPGLTEPPGVGDVELWLEKNEARSSQPYATFVAALERAGVSATQLRVRRKTIELEERSVRWPNFAWPQFRGRSPPVASATAASSQSGSAEIPAGWFITPALHDAFRLVTTTIADVAIGAFQLLVSIGTALADLVTILFLWALLAVADHGLRPAKVVWWVLPVLAFFWCFFWFRLKIVGFEPKRAKPDDQPAGTSPPAPILWPVTVLFLFDRLIPIYRIREEHYAINNFYRKASAEEITRASGPPTDPPYALSYLRRKYLVWPSSEVERARVEKWLVILRVIGVCFTVFLLAAINALTAS